MRRQEARSLGDDGLVAELRRVAQVVGSTTVTMAQFNGASTTVNSAAFTRRFGSWRQALERAGLTISNRGKRYSDDDYFENLLRVWTHHGRQPRYREMDSSPSEITSGAYEKRWGTWRTALRAFVERVNADRLGPPPEYPRVLAPASIAPPQRKTLRTRTIPLGMRYDVLRRDHFKCLLCGNSPSIDPTCVLHVDHVVSWSEGGDTIMTNVRSLCQRCNVGKSNKVEVEANSAAAGDGGRQLVFIGARRA